MARRTLRCVVDLNLHAVSAPGVWLPSREDVYLTVSMFGESQTSRLLTSVFPLLVHETLRFEKLYFTALDPIDVAKYLDEELVVFELVQVSEYTDGVVRLASYSANARDFLFPYLSLAPSYSSADREILLSRTVAFPGISPKLEFATKTVIRESYCPEVEVLEDALERRTYRTMHRSPTRLSRSRSKSPSLARRLADLDLSYTIDPRPPFVVRKLDSELIGRTPGGGPDSHAKSRVKKLRRSTSADSLVSKGPLCDLCETSMRHSGRYFPGHTRYYHENSRFCTVCRHAYTCGVCDAYMRCYGRPYWGHSQFHHPGMGLRCLCGKVRDPIFKSTCKIVDDADLEVADLTSRKPVFSSTVVRPRSASPVLSKASFRARYGYWPYTSTYYSTAAERALDDLRLSRLYNSRLYDLDLARSLRYPYYWY